QEPPAPQRLSPRTPAVYCNYAPAPKSTKPARTSCMSWNSWIAPSNNKSSHKRFPSGHRFTGCRKSIVPPFRTETAKRAITLSLFLHPPDTETPSLPGRGPQQKGRTVFRREARQPKIKGSLARRQWRHVRRGHARSARTIHLALSADAALLQRVIRRHGKQRRGRLLFLYVGDRIRRFTEARIALYRLDHNLQVRRIPALVGNDDRLGVSGLARGNRPRESCSLCADPIDRLHAQVFLL